MEYTFRNGNTLKIEYDGVRIDFKEEEHPRNEKGQFTSKGGNAKDTVEDVMKDTISSYVEWDDNEPFMTKGNQDKFYDDIKDNSKVLELYEKANPKDEDFEGYDDWITDMIDDLMGDLMDNIKEGKQERDNIKKQQRNEPR